MPHRMWPRGECHHGWPLAGDTHGTPGHSPRCSIPSREQERDLRGGSSSGGTRCLQPPGPSRCPGDRGGLGHRDTAGRGHRERPVTVLGDRGWQGPGSVSSPGANSGLRCPGGWHGRGGLPVPSGMLRTGRIPAPGSPGATAGHGALGDGNARGEHPGSRCPGGWQRPEGTARFPAVTVRSRFRCPGGWHGPWGSSRVPVPRGMARSGKGRPGCRCPRGCCTPGGSSRIAVLPQLPVPHDVAIPGGGTSRFPLAPA